MDPAGSGPQIQASSLPCPQTVCRKRLTSILLNIAIETNSKGLATRLINKIKSLVKSVCTEMKHCAALLELQTACLSVRCHLPSMPGRMRRPGLSSELRILSHASTEAIINYYKCCNNFCEFYFRRFIICGLCFRRSASAGLQSHPKDCIERK